MRGSGRCVFPGPGRVGVGGGGCVGGVEVGIVMLCVGVCVRWEGGGVVRCDGY